MPPVNVLCSYSYVHKPLLERIHTWLASELIICLPTSLSSPSQLFLPGVIVLKIIITCLLGESVALVCNHLPMKLDEKILLHMQSDFRKIIGLMF